MLSTTAVIYHRNCAPDGLTAAALCYKKFGANADYIPMAYGEDLWDVVGKAIKGFGKEMSAREYLSMGDVYFVDFSIPADALEELCEVATKVVVLDHHKSAIDKLKEFRNRRAELVLDEGKCGALLTWNYFWPEVETPPVIVQHADDYDRWQFKMVHTKAFCAGLGMYVQTVETWCRLVGLMQSATPYNECVKDGSVVLQYQQQVIDKAVSKALRCSVGTHNLITVEATNLISEIGNALVEKYPKEDVVCIFHHDLKNGFTKLSFRSNKNLAQKYAEELGGGGQRNAAGAEVYFVPKLAE